VVGGVGGVALIAYLVFRLIRRQNVQQEREEESPNRSIPEQLLDEIECDNPLTLASTAVNSGFELEADDILSNRA
jgi:hypothetical protein